MPEGDDTQVLGYGVREDFFVKGLRVGDWEEDCVEALEGGDVRFGAGSQGYVGDERTG